MIELNEIKVKEKPIYVEPIKKKKNHYIGIIIYLIFMILALILVIPTMFIKSKNVMREQQAEIDRLQNKVYQQIELIDSLKQVY